MKRYQNVIMMIGVALLIALPLWMIQKPAPGPDGKEVDIFRGADDQAAAVISKVAPGYRPWFKPLVKPPSGEVGSLLFSLQAAIGAGFIGYYLGVSTTRAKLRRETDTESRC